ncbi:hypothetical protein GX50_02851 [[Emmonsia] crescens]|uniref:Uncharacterized protein n=1 Tax=[Emmonsia] crescens TaxID=73230 RepID=A0A2B7ZMH1_9EURO|nr:hypothetical protein GX50_02851 [Emmonsia crescens]
MSNDQPRHFGEIEPEVRDDILASGAAATELLNDNAFENFYYQVGVNRVEKSHKILHVRKSEL